MHYHCELFFSLAILAHIVTVSLAVPTLSRPHILFIVADDYGWNDIGYHQNAVSSANPTGAPTTSPEAGFLRTPTLDTLSTSSNGVGAVRLENYYVQPLCSPTRSTFMTGRYPFHTGVGPDVIQDDWPYGVPARETFLPELLNAGGYATAAVGKWHLGMCDERYLATYRGFETFFGYLAGAQSYFHHRSDFRNGSVADTVPPCAGKEVDDIYELDLYLPEVERIVRQHSSNYAAASNLVNASSSVTKPLFLYLAFQSVHNPYDTPPTSIININATYPAVRDYTRRIYAGMVTAMDSAVQRVTEFYKEAGLWDDTLLVFTTDNGGIGPGNNYPLRGTKVYNWEGGVRGVAFVRGTKSSLAPIATATAGVRTQLMHSSDWLPTLVAGVAKLPLSLSGAGRPALPLDGHNQWNVLANDTAAIRDVVVHNVPIAQILLVNTSRGPQYTTAACRSVLNPDVLGADAVCHPFGATGGAIRRGHMKLLITHDGRAPWGDSSQPMEQIPPPGFEPAHRAPVPQPFNGVFYLFNITADPTESVNLAENNPEILHSMLQLYRSYASNAVPDLASLWGFHDPASHISGGSCMGPFLGGHFCPYGTEFDCFIQRSALHGSPIDTTHQTDASECQHHCVVTSNCSWWSFEPLNEDHNCHTLSSRSGIAACASCTWGPRTCPM